jgi:hypothetical protein
MSPGRVVALDSLRLSVSKPELVRALRVLSSNRRRRFSSVVPIWLHYDAERRELRLGEDHGTVLAVLPALGTWPAAGATVNLYALRNAALNASTNDVELLAVDEGVLVPTTRGYVALELLQFGPTSAALGVIPRSDRHSDLPLFRWATRRTG